MTTPQVTRCLHSGFSVFNSTKDIMFLSILTLCVELVAERKEPIGEGMRTGFASMWAGQSSNVWRTSQRPTTPVNLASFLCAPWQEAPHLDPEKHETSGQQICATCCPRCFSERSCTRSPARFFVGAHSAGSKDGGVIKVFCPTDDARMKQCWLQASEV